MARNNEQPPVRCSFCGKRENQASRLIAGPGVYICSDCVEACSDLLRQEYSEEYAQRLLKQWPLALLRDQEISIPEPDWF